MGGLHDHAPTAKPTPTAIRKKANVGEDLAREIKRRAKEETIVSDLTYDLRSGDPDFIDKLVAATFGNIAMDASPPARAAYDRHRQRLLRSHADPRSQARARKIDVATAYNTERYRPNYSNKLGLPIFLTKAN